MLFKKDNLHIYKAQVFGMRCGMCESHINDVVRKNFKIKKVKSSRMKNETLIYAVDELDITKIKEVIASTGYEVRGVEKVN